MNEIIDELVAICRAFGVFERESVCCGDVSVAQCVALQALLRGPHEVGALAQHLGVTASATTRLVDGLEKRRWVRRTRGEEDRRRVAIELTAAGRREADRLLAATERGVTAVLARIPDAKRREIAESLRALRSALDDARDEISSCCVTPRR